MGWKCKKCGYDRIESNVCVSCWIRVEVDTIDRDAELDTIKAELDEVCWDDLNQTIDGYACCHCGNGDRKFEEVAEWTE